MKIYSHWVLCLCVLWNICRKNGSSRCKKDGHHSIQFRSSVFRSMSGGKHSLTNAATAQLILCAVRCLDDDRCIGIKQHRHQEKCRTLATISYVGYIWMRNSGALKEACKIFRKATFFVSANVSPRKWTKTRNSIKGELRWLDTNGDKADSRKVELKPLTDARQAVITSLLGSSEVVILLLDKPRTLCSAMIHAKFKCRQVPPNWDAIGGMQVYLGYLYVSAGKSLFRMKIKSSSMYRKLSRSRQLVVKLPGTPSEIAVDALKGKRMIFYSTESNGQISRILKYKNKDQRMDPLNISCNHFTFTIDPIGHVMYVLTDDRKLSLIRDIHTENPLMRSNVMKVDIPYDWPITKLLFSANTINLIWPSKNLVLFLDVQKKRARRRLLSNRLISRPPRVITAISLL